MEDIDWIPDRRNSITSATGRLVVKGMRGVQVRPEASAKTQIAALMDLLDLHLSDVDPGQRIDPGRVMLRVPSLKPEARGALGTICDALVTDLRVDVLEENPPRKWAKAEVGWDPTAVSEYKRWPELLALPREIPDLVADIVHKVGDPAVRAYPMLSTKDGWSLRVEGLEVARGTSEHATLKVGKDGKHGGRSLPRKTWIAATGHTEPVKTDDVSEASALIAAFAKAWHRVDSDDQDEHALESRILRGEARVSVDSKRLDLIESDDVVNWGSQFPTKWGPGGSARYLDALLRDETTPWAIEMKVQGSGGVGQYYRHAVAQAVLYREFIREAKDLHFWFERRGLRAEDCKAAVVVPEFTNPRQVHWREHVARLCDAFDVAYVEVSPRHARRH